MISIARTKQLLKDPHMSDEQAEEVRDAFRSLAEIIFEQWQAERRKKLPLQKDKKRTER